MIKKYRMYVILVVNALLRRRSRMLIALLAVAVGATIISGMITVYNEVPQQLGREFRAYGANLLLLPGQDQTVLPEATVQEVGKLLNGYEIVGMAPFLYERVKINEKPVFTGGTNFSTLRKVSPYWQINGTWPEPGKQEILIGDEIAQQMGIKPGQTVLVNGGAELPEVQMVVSGIVHTGGKEEQFAFMELSLLQKLLQKPQQISLVQLSVVADGAGLASIQQEIRQKIPAVEPQLVQQIASSEETVLSKLQALVLLVTAVVLLLTLICVATTMMAVVTERRKEIGLKKALGAENRHIILEFLGEGCVLGLFGGMLGSGLGYLFAQSVSLQVFNRSIAFVPLIAVLSVLLSIAVTGAASLLPVRIATNVEPATVLRGE
ncbi:ABC transporter permease [Propionispora hippei]|uniref:Putative ABC transport system permease protein n=1 Tax=Propionispora hippei DSM 15287 TaxID=1123003 RepID=A0A1M6BJL1_9FIRM|nr:ABC transporter permease [Propionispora hippei]SHI48889.1 putative ABC transport system permease protein [Propionispora hippei DSM 15287]